MRIKIHKDTQYQGVASPLTESFYLEVESERGESPMEVADAYLKLKEKLKEGMKEEE